MAFQSYAAVGKKKFGGMMGIKADELVLRITTPKKGSPRLVIKLGKDVMKKSKLTPSTMVDLLVDSDQGKGLLAQDSKGWKLKVKESGTGEIVMSWNSEALFDFSGDKQSVDWKIVKAGVEFNLPK
ncbi:MAG: hypothetical protein R6V46_15195 [Desulfatiglandaceae bacterium]